MQHYLHGFANMMTTTRVVLALVLGVLAQNTQAAPVRLVDSVSNTYLRQSSTVTRISRPDLSGVVSALTGLQPSSSLDNRAQQRISDVLANGSPLKKPATHVSVSVSGLNADDVESIFTGRNQHQFESEGSVDDLVSDLAAANREAQFHLLDQLAAQSLSHRLIQTVYLLVTVQNPAVKFATCIAPEHACKDGDCLSTMLPKLTQILGVEHVPGYLNLGSSKLDLSGPAERMFATELATTVAGAQALMEKLAAGQDVALVDASLLSLPALSADQQDAARASAVKALSWLIKELDTVLAGDYTVQVAQHDAQDLDSIVAAKENKRRRLQETVVIAANPTASNTSSFPGTEQEQKASAKLYSAKAAAYGAFVLLLYFMVAGVYCLCFMPFKRDTMLFGSKKQD